MSLDETALSTDGRSSRDSLATKWFHALVVLALGAMYIANSSALIAYNKYLITVGRFPFAVPLVFMHATFCSLFAVFLYKLKPGMFPSLTDESKRINVDSNVIFKGAMPIAVLFSVQLALSNSAYLHSSVAFLQMMKEANLALVYTFSLAVALERFSWRNVGLLAAVLAATTLTIHGEMHFSSTGFALQGVSQIFESTKIVFQAMLLSNTGYKLDALAYVLLVMPFCAVILGSSLCVSHLWMPSAIPMPTWSDLVLWSPHLVANACLAFSLNVVIALFVQQSSAISFILAGIVKDAMIILSSVVFLREMISVMQFIGFGFQLSFILLYSLAKSFPDHFRDGLVSGFAILLSIRKPGTQESDSSSLKTPRQKDYGSLQETGRAGNVTNGKH